MGVNDREMNIASVRVLWGIHLFELELNEFREMYRARLGHKNYLIFGFQNVKLAPH